MVLKRTHKTVTSITKVATSVTKPSDSISKPITLVSKPLAFIIKPFTKASWTTRYLHIQWYSRLQRL